MGKLSLLVEFFRKMRYYDKVTLMREGCGPLVKRRYISTRLIKENMIIDQAIIDRAGRILIARKTILDKFLIDALQKMNIGGVYIREGEEDPEASQENIDFTPSPQVAKIIEKQIVPDRSRVKLSESVKKQVSAGMQFIYNNPSSNGFTDAANTISDSLLSAITENDAIALDISALKVSDEYTFKHSVDVATIAMIVAKKSGMSPKDVHKIGIAGLLHDIGKSQIPNELLNKAGKLTEEEFALMKKHSLYGYNILKDKPDIAPGITKSVLQHHEKISGKGYPLGLTSPQICPYAKILTIADIYDALVTERPYKKAFSQRDAVEMIMAMTDDLDVGCMKNFLSSVILYPVNSTVLLSNGESARVVSNHENYPLRPKVVGLKSGKIYDLSEDVHCASIIIES